MKVEKKLSLTLNIELKVSHLKKVLLERYFKMSVTSICERFIAPFYLEVGQHESPLRGNQCCMLLAQPDLLCADSAKPISVGSAAAEHLMLILAHTVRMPQYSKCLTSYHSNNNMHDCIVHIQSLS